MFNKNEFLVFNDGIKNSDYIRCKKAQIPKTLLDQGRANIKRHNHVPVAVSLKLAN
jgi:hypothetical protein